MFESRDLEELIRIAAAGGGFDFDGGSRETEELIRLAAAGSGKGAHLNLFGMESRDTEELIRIAAAGDGRIVFRD